MYLDKEGFGNSFPSNLKGGAAGDGHNNVVTRTVDETHQVMRIANGIGQGQMSKTPNYMQRDIKTYC